MFKTCAILVGALLGSCLLGACGQQGPLFISQDPAAAQRATLPDILLRRTPQADAPPSAPSTPTSP
ncbi:MAG: hypothetical protein EBT70_16700 [Betaproteobacteria bacterium]|nr:hypothetical protein [Betaproteobacteria bacterium]